MRLVCLLQTTTIVVVLAAVPSVVAFTPISQAAATKRTCLSMTSTSTAAPFGAWKSPITSKSITSGSVSFGALHYVNNNNGNGGELYWLEGRPQEGGRQVLCKFDTKDNESTTTIDVSPQESNVRTRVHEYGGGAVTFDNDSGQIFFSEFTTQQLCRLEQNDGTATATPLTPNNDNDARFRFADGVVSNNNTMYCVREDHEQPEPANVVNQIVQIFLKNTDNNTERMKVVATGKDFYAAPRVSPDGTQLAYICWNHPNMPWDATELRVVSLNDNTDNTVVETTTKHTLVAGADGDTSILQPLWHPMTGELYYISDENGYYNIYKYNSKGTTTCVLPMKFDFGGAAPGWRLGQQGFQFLPDGRLVATYTKEGKSVLVVATLSDGDVATDVSEYGTDNGLPMQFGGVIPGGNDDLYFIGGSPSTPTSIYQWSLKDQQPAKLLKCSSTLSFDKGMISTPQQIEFPTTNDWTAFGYYYPPQNSDYHAPTTDTTAPPLLVKAHGGPTACTGTSFNAGIQFWTSRGFAVLDVDYGGSTGYGRDYRRRLRQSWGIVDIDDVCAGAQYLVTRGKANPQQLCIDGGSAGGYTTLGALAFKDVFQAGCSLYGVGDLTALAGDTHKFESRYLDGLVGAYPEEEELYKKRSPIESIDTLSCPILLLQGDEDKIVPPNQAKMMHEALLKKGIPTCLKIYKGEQHGFRKAENIEDALDSELAFYGKVFGIANVPGAVDLEIDNMM